MARDERCEQCGGKFNRPGRYDCVEGHPPRDIAWKIVAAIEDDLNDRRGFHLDGLGDDLREHIQDVWLGKIRAILAEGRADAASG